ncbi:MAG: protein BatD, partial [Gammaproteobacteria bacterium]
MVRQIRLILCLFCAGLVFMPFSVEVHAEPAQITASVDRKSLSRDQSLQLSILIQGEAHGRPDISPLEKSFEIVSSGQSSSYSFVNGRQHRETQLSYTLFPRHAGKLVIPSLKVGDLHTEPIEITVSDSSADPLSGSQGTKKPDIWLEATLDQDSVYVQQQLILTLRIYQGVNLAQAQLSELKIPEVLVKPFGKDRQYQENRNGRVWTVTERRYALFPQKSGTMNIPAVRLEGQAVGSSGNFFFSRTRPIRARSTDLSVEVLPIPNEWQQSYWLPASDLTLMDSWSADEFRVGESVTRKLKIVARGLLSSQLPPLFEGGGITGHQRLKFYTESARMQDTNDSDDWQGVREESMAILPTQSGDVTLPEIRVMWWDTDENKARQAIIPAKVIHITAPAVSR